MQIAATIIKHGTQVVTCYHLLVYKTLANSVGLKSLVTGKFVYKPSIFDEKQNRNDRETKKVPYTVGLQ